MNSCTVAIMNQRKRPAVEATGLTIGSIRENEMADVILPEVEYRQVVGFPGYRVGSDGSVWSCLKRGGDRGPTDTWRQLRTSKGRSGHLRVSLARNKVLHPRGVHQIVLEAFVGPCPQGMMCRHFPDRDPTNNTPGNLSWGTPQQNMDDKSVHGTLYCGEKVKWRKVSADDAVKMRELFADGSTATEIAMKFGITRSTAGRIIRGKNWKSASGPVHREKLQQILSDDDVREIRRRHPSEGSEALARAFGVARNTIVCIMCGKRRQNVA